ncbi:MAG: type VII secretion-associated serine protease mycosin [Actinomycetota bacterium]
MRALRAAVCALLLAAAGAVPANAAPVTADAVECGRGESAWALEAPYALTRLGLRDAWDVARGQGVTVAVVDSGVEKDNPHLVDVVGPGTTFVGGDPEPGGTSAVNNHGTAIASLIAAQRVEGSGLVGVAPRATIMPVRVFASTDEQDVAQGNGLRMDRIAAGIRYAAENGARVINVSLSSPAPEPELEAAVRFAQERGALIVASTGNRDPDSGEPDGDRYPAAYPGVLGVTAVDTADRVTDASIHGPAVDVAAPGQEVISAWFDEKDCVNSPGVAAPQTSWATGYVSGVAALVASAHPDASAEEIAYRIMASADRPVRAERDDSRGWGIVQPYLAMVMTLDPARAGPPLPGAADAEPPAPQTELVAVREVPDELAAAREQVLWWALLGAAGVGLVTLLGIWRRAPRRVST